MPHPNGFIEVDLVKNESGGISGFISIPEKTTGMFYWNGKQQILNEGKCEVKY
jgi:hypothetical protein